MGMARLSQQKGSRHKVKVSWSFSILLLLHKEQKSMYGILEAHRDAMNHGVCTVNNDFMYHYGQYFVITGYCPIKIEE